MKKIILLIFVMFLVSISLVFAIEVDLADGLVVVYDFSQIPATSDLEDQIGAADSTTDANVVRIEGRVSDWAWNFSETLASNVELPTSVLDGRGAVTLNCWVNVNRYSGNRGAIFYGTRGDTAQTGFWMLNSPDLFRIAATDGSSVSHNFVSVIPVNNWFMMTLTYDGTTFISYLNGTAYGNSSLSGNLDVSHNLHIGYNPDNTYRSNAMIDECYVWDHAVSGANISDMWENEWVHPFEAPDIINPPSISDCKLTSPNPGGDWENYTNDITPTGNCSITDINGVVVGRASNDTDSFDDMTSSRNMTQGSGDDWIWTIIGADQLVPDGNYSLCFTASDDSGNNHSTCNATMNITVDTTEPFVSIIHPTNDLTFETDNFDLNYSIYDVIIGIDEIWYNLNDGINVTITNNLTIYVSAGKYNLTLWANDSLGNINNDSVSFTSVFNLTFNGLGNLTKYEYQTNVTLLSNHNITIIVDTNVDLFSVTANTDYVYQIDTLRQNKLNGSYLNLSFTSIGNFTIELDSRVDLYNASINITGIDVGGDYPEDSLLLIGSNRTLLKGILYGNQLFNNKVICIGETTACNLSFGSPGRQSFYFNISMVRINTSNLIFNLSFSLSGFDVDIGNEFDYIEYFNDTNKTTNFINEIDISLSSPLYIHDNFQDNSSTSNSWDNWDITRTDARWNYNISGAGFDIEDSYFEVWCEERVGFHQYKCGTDWFTLKSNGLNINNHSMFNILTRVQTNAGEGGPGCNEVAEAHWRITDGSNTVNFITLNGNDALTKSNITVRNTPIGSDSWEVYDDDVLDTTISTAGLSSSADWNLEWSAKTGISGSCIEASQHATFLELYKVELGGIALNKSDLILNFTNGSFESKVLFTAPSNITAVLIKDVIGEFPTGTNIIYEFTNDNGSTWEIALEDERHAFSSDGNELKIRINMTTNDVDITPIIRNYRIIITSGASANITIDIGDDGIVDANLTLLNESNSPYNFSLDSNPIISYAIDNCMDSETCLIKNKLTVSDVGGVIQIHNINISLLINPLPLKTDYFELSDLSGVEVGISQGEIKIDDPKFDYRGNHNLSLNVSGTNYVLRVYYSDFNVSLPENISWYDVFPKSRTSQNVTPFGQSNTTPIWFINNLAYEEPFDVYVRVNETINKTINITFSNESFKNGVVSFVLNTTAQKICSDVLIGGNCSIWNWIDLGNFTSAFYLPYYDFSTICSTCVLTSGHWLTNFIQE